MTTGQPHEVTGADIEFQSRIHAFLASDEYEPHPSRPTPAYGAPDIGAHRTDGAWNWGNPEGRPAAWTAFGQDTDTEDPE